VGQKLGQHFLIRESILRRIAAAVCPEPGGTVIEIGPGRGALTRWLLERADRVVAIELDAGLAEYLRKRLPNRPKLEIVHADVLNTDLSQWGPAAVAGNLPYYITSPILEKILRLGNQLRSSVVLVQREVAARLTAQPGSRDYGFLTVAANTFAHPELLFPVPAAAFRPAPKVESAAVRLTPHPAAPADPEAFLRFVGHCFRHKRKTLRNNLAGLYPAAIVDRLPEASLRAEQLSLDRFLALFEKTGAAHRESNALAD